MAETDGCKFGSLGRHLYDLAISQYPSVAIAIRRILDHTVTVISSMRLWMAAWLLAVAVASGCRPDVAEPGSKPEGLIRDLKKVPTGERPGLEVAEYLPSRGQVKGYLGSESCRECHVDEHSSWHRSYHRTMTQWPTPDAIQADFNNVVLTNAGVRYHLNLRSNEYWVRIESALPPTPDRPTPEPIDVPMGLVTGSHHMQVFWVPNAAGNTQVGFPFTWLIPEKRWVPRNSTFLRPPSMVHRPEVWNIVCSRCHATGTEPHIDRQNRAFFTRVGDLGISCEACHGPGERHVALARSLPKKTDSSSATSTKTPAPSKPDLAMVHPEKIDPTRSSQICGFCHSMKWYDHTTGWEESGFAYRPGDDLESTTPVIRAQGAHRTPRLEDFLSRNPTLLADFFWPDGMIRVSGREYNGLIESPCYGKPKDGKSFGCISCHSMHNSRPDDQLIPSKLGNLSCLPCHEKFREPSALASHTHHLAGSSGSECINCHMPHTTYGVLKAIRSHQISSPSVASELSTGRPNACNLCHLDKSLVWTANSLSNWFGQAVPPMEPETTRVADSIRLGLSGDAGQRAIIAWHLGWPEAVKISGTNWIAPLAEQLLRDPYAAVRCVAERSARSIGLPVDPGYDFVPPPSGTEGVLNPAAAGEAVPAFLKLAGNPTGTSVQPTLNEWLRQRNNRDVRLRE